MSGLIIERSIPFEIVRAEASSNGDGLTLDGYAAVWDSPTLIDSYEGCFNEQIQMGAFKKTIRETTPKLQFDHGYHPLIGSIPIGVINTLEEDDRGLHVLARLSDNWLIEPVRDAIMDRAIDGMSFRFEVIRDSWTDKNGTPIKAGDVQDLLWMPSDIGPLNRTLIEVKCSELGPVVWPAYTDTTVSARARSVAREILGDTEMRHDMLSGLVRSAVEPKQHTRMSVSVSKEFPARDVALVLLYGDNVRDAVPEGHPSGPQDGAPPLVAEEHPSEPEEARDAPSDGGESSTDAPLPVEHPSKPRQSSIDPAVLKRDAEIRNQYLAMVIKGSGKYDA